jgi:alkyl hydroperoxide reductase subunit D
MEQIWNQTLGEPQTSIQRDLYMNLTKLMSDSSLEPKERYLNLLAISKTLNFAAFQTYAIEELKKLELTDEQIQEAKESAAIMGMLNTYYKFKSYLPESAKEPYARAGLRMQSLMKPANGKELFEQMAFSVSVVNGCPSCIASHEEALRKVGTSTEKIHDLARLASVMKGVHALLKS